MVKRKYIVDGQWHDGDENAMNMYAPVTLSKLGVFETLKVEDGDVHFFKDHYRRAKKGLAALELTMPVNSDVLKKQVEEIVSLSKLKHARIRITFWFDDGMHYAVAIFYHKPYPIEKYRRGFDAVFVTRNIDADKNANVKSLDYKKYMSAFAQAHRKRCDEALIVNQHGEVVEGSRSNLFIFQKDRLVTPPLNSGCLSGTMRAQIIQLAKQLGLRVVEKRLLKPHVLAADEVFLTNSTREIMPVRSIDGKIIGNFKKTNKLREKFTKIAKK